METEWINRNEWFEPNAGKKEESYREHDARMRVFAQSHASDLKVKFSRRDLINIMWPVLVKGIESEAGGSTGRRPPSSAPA